MSTSSPRLRLDQQHHHIFTTRQLDLHADVQCDSCESSPIWGQNYVCASCPDSNYCSRCAASFPHQSDHVFYCATGTHTHISGLSQSVLAQIAQSLAEDGPVRQQLKQVVELDVGKEDTATLDDHITGLLNIDDTVKLDSAHPFLSLIPGGLKKLSSHLSVESNLGLLLEACPALEALRNLPNEKWLLPERMDFQTLIEHWADHLPRSTDVSHLVSFGVGLIAALELPKQPKSLSQKLLKSASCLPAFLIGDNETPDYPDYHGSTVLFCIWAMNCRAAVFPDITDSASLFDAVQMMMSSELEAEGSVSIKSFQLGDLDAVFSVPLLEMRRTKVPRTQQQCNASEVVQQQQRLIHVFVSHAWRTPRHPDPNGDDWRNIQTFLWAAIIAVVDTMTILQGVGVPTPVLKSLSTTPSDCMSNTEHPSGGLVTAELFSDLVACAAEELTHEENEVPRHTRYVRVARRVHIWFDFMSLPQTPRTKEEDMLFRATLSKLADVQNLMHTVTISLDCGYVTRAWCVAEWLNGKSISSPLKFKGEDSLGAVLPLGLRKTNTKMNAVRALLHPGFRNTEQILRSLNLSITNGKEDSEAVCRILWEASRSFLKSFEILYGSREEWMMIAQGKLDDIFEVLGSIHRNDFNRNMFDSLPAVKGQKSPSTQDKGEQEAHISIFWYTHELLKGEDRAKCFHRDLLGLKVVVSALKSCHQLQDLSVSVGFTKTTMVKSRKGVMLCGFSCDEAICDVADIVLPMKGSAVMKALLTNAQMYQRRLNRLFHEDEDSDDNPEVESNQ